MRWSHVAVLTPAFYMSRILGVTPLLVRKNRDGSLSFKTHRALIVISVLNIITMIWNSYFMSTIHLPRVMKIRPSYIPYSSCMAVSCFLSIVALGNAVINRRQTMRAFNEVHNLSRQLLREFGHNRIGFEVLFAPITFVFSSQRYILQVCTYGFSVAALTLYHHSYLIQLSSESLAAGFLFYVESFFKCLNTELSDIKLYIGSTKTDMQTWLTLCRLQRLRKMHNRICDLSDIVCERFALDFFINFGIILTILLSTLYAGIWARSANFTSLMNGVNMSNYVFLILRLAHICFRSACVMEQSEVTNAKVRALMTSQLPAEIKQEIYHFTLQTMLRKVEITAWGFYALRMETITTLVYLVSTYLVMVVNVFEVI